MAEEEKREEALVHQDDSGLLQELFPNGINGIRDIKEIDEIHKITIRKILTVIKKYELKRKEEGFSSLYFMMGVVNCLLVAYVFGKYPQHFWILWLVEASIMIPLKVYKDWTAKPLCQILYYMDYCWIMNFLVVIGMYLLLVLDENWIDPAVRKQLYLTVIGVCSGPLMGATAVLPFVGVIFHDQMVLAGVFIHLVTPMFVYCFVWHGDLIQEHYPFFHVSSALQREEINFFPPDYGPLFFPGQGLGTIAGNTVLLYVIWFIPYCTWMFLLGLDLTRKHRFHRDAKGRPLATSKYDTVFNSTFSNEVICVSFGTFCWGRPVEVSRRQVATKDFESRDFVALMSLHSSSITCATYTIAFFNYSNQYLHAASIWFLVFLTVYRGAQHYVGWAKSVTTNLLQEEFAEIWKVATKQS